MHKAYWLQRQDELKKTFARCKVDSVTVATNEDYVKALMMLFAMRS